ncbi:MAG TPA: hypothetical protein VGE51_14615 [Fontimonas sp.]
MALRAGVLSAGLFGLSACGGGSDGDSIRLDGKVVAPAAGSAEVTVAVGNKRYVVETDAAGLFDVAIGTSNADAPVSIIARLGGDLDFVELKSNLGRFGDLLTAAGDDERLSAAENIRVNLSSLSTADAVLADEAADTAAGKAFELGDGVDPDAALTLAAVLQLAIEQPGSFGLPEGSATTLALARDDAARDRFIADIKRTAATALELAKEQLLIDPEVVGAVDAAAVPGELIVSIFGGDKADERAPLALCYGCSYRTIGFTFNADGTGTFFADFSGAATTWRRIGTVLQVRFAVPYETEFGEYGACEGNNDTQRIVRQDIGYDLVMLSDTAVSTTRVARLTTPDCPTRPLRTRRTTVAGTQLTDANTTALSAAQFGGQKVVLPVLKPQAAEEEPFDVRFEPDVLVFDANTAASGRYVVDAATWSVADGSLQLSYGDTTGRFREARDIDGRARLLLADFSSGGQRYVTVARSFAGNDFAAFATEEVPGRYFYLGVGNEFDDDPRLDGLRLRLDAGGRGAVEEDDINSAGEVVVSESSYKVRWTVDGSGELEFRRYQNAADVDDGCDGQSDSCEQLDARRFVPIARVGERYYVLDRREFIDSASGAVRLRFNAPMFYDRVPLDDAKSAAVTARSFRAQGSSAGVFGPPLRAAR